MGKFQRKSFELRLWEGISIKIAVKKVESVGIWDGLYYVYFNMGFTKDYTMDCSIYFTYFLLQYVPYHGDGGQSKSLTVRFVRPPTILPPILSNNRTRFIVRYLTSMNILFWGWTKKNINVRKMVYNEQWWDHSI